MGAVLFPFCPDSTECSIANASKTLRYAASNSQIQKEAPVVIYSLQKFHQLFYGQKAILVTDHKLLVSLFSPTKGTLDLATSWLARWALTLSQYDYSIKYRRMVDHINADALSCLPTEDVKFDAGGTDSSLHHKSDQSTA